MADSEKLAPLEKAATARHKEYCQFALSKSGQVLIRSIKAIKARRADICFGENMANTLDEMQDILDRALKKAEVSCDEAGIPIPNELFTKVRNVLKH